MAVCTCVYARVQGWGRGDLALAGPSLFRGLQLPFRAVPSGHCGYIQVRPEAEQGFSLEKANGDFLSSLLFPTGPTTWGQRYGQILHYNNKN